MNRKVSPLKDKNKISGTVFDLLDEAYFSLKENLVDILALHFLACVPFLLGVMFFIFRFGNYHSIDNDIIRWSLILTALFCWKNFIQCLLSAKMMNIIARRENHKLTLKSAGMIIFKQTILQSPGPLLIVFLLGAPWVVWILVPVGAFMLPAFFYTSTVICATEPERGLWSSLEKISFHISSNFIKLLGVMLVSIFGTIVLTINIMVIIFFIPFMLKTFWGIDTQFTIAGGMSMALFFNTTLWSIILALVYLCIDPFCRMLFVLRVFYCESIGKGWDIQSSLHRISSKISKTLLIFLLLFSTILLKADTNNTTRPALEKKTELSSKKLEKNINKTLQQLQFQWRTPKQAEEKQSWIFSYLKIALEYLRDTIHSIVDYIRDLFKSSNTDVSKTLSGFKLFMVNTWKVLKYLVPILLILTILFILWRKFRSKKITSTTNLSNSARRPDLTKEDVVADELQEHEWLKLSKELLDKGDFRLALRALYLAGISALSQRRLLLVRPYKTDYEYLHELRRRAHTMPNEILVFENNVSVFQRIWYGDYPVDREVLDEYMERSKILFSEKKPESEETEINED